MRFPYEMPAAVCLALIAGGVGCAKSKEKPVASQDSMLMRDLAEANKNTAEAAAVDNSLNTVRTTGGGSEITASTTSKPRSSSNTQIVSRTASSGTPVLTSRPRPAPPLVANDAPAPTTVPTELSPTGGAGDPCDSPAAVDQQSCLNRSIEQNDVDLNRTYQDLIAESRKSGGPELEQRFRQAQRDWVDQRDLECRQRTRNEEGALWARVRARCLADYSAKKTAELQRSLDSLRGH
jgi:uncharacterized protein YecT (DUF1311 family)